MTNKLLISLAILFTTSAFGQQDSTRQEILNYQGSKAEVIEKGRALLLEYFLKDNKAKVSNIFDLLQSEENRSYLAFFPGERSLLFYWLGQFDELVRFVNREDTLLINLYSNMTIVPQRDMLADNGIKKLRAEREFVLDAIENSMQSPSEKAFLKVHLSFLIADFESNEHMQDSLNAISTRYLDAHPNSTFENYVKTKIRFQYVPSKWACAWELFTGYDVLTDNLHKHFYNPFLFGLSLDVCYKNWTLYGRMSGGISWTKDSIAFSTVTWPRKSYASFYLPELSIGYVTYEDRHVVVTPFLGIGWASIKPPEDDENGPLYPGAGFRRTTSFTMGTSVDFKFGNNRRNESGISYWFVNMRYSYNIPNFKEQYTGFNGNIHSITVGVGCFGRRLLRKY